MIEIVIVLIDILQFPNLQIEGHLHHSCHYRKDQPVDTVQEALFGDEFIEKGGKRVSKEVIPAHPLPMDPVQSLQRGLAIELLKALS